VRGRGDRRAYRTAAGRASGGARYCERRRRDVHGRVAHVLTVDKRRLVQRLSGELDRHHLLILYERLGDILQQIGRSGDARAAYEHAVSQIPKHDRSGYARRHRKIGSTFDAQRHYEAALHSLDRADSMLGPQSTDPISEWWQEWMWLQQARLEVH
jgi:tetratricopeptide (TPR) repeat protein